MPDPTPLGPDENTLVSRYIITHMRMFIAIPDEVGVSMWGVYTNTAVLQSRLIDPHKDLEA